jgi:precorrin-2 dehydrogenase/sirohydrochlorin ferrochelatase
MTRLFPIAIRIEGRRCVVVGGGAVAARRAEALLEAGGAVTVVAPEACAEIREWAAEGRIAMIEAPYRPAHLDGAFLVVAATDRPEVNAAIAKEARARSVLCNDAEVPDRGDFVVPSILRRGDLLITVTTGGHSPALAARLRDELAERFGPEFEEYVALLGEVRAHVLETIPDARRRRAALGALAREDTILMLIREGRASEARARAFSCISSLSD